MIDRRERICAGRRRWRTSPPLSCWGLAGNWAQGMTAAARATLFQWSKDNLGITWIKDSGGWAEQAAYPSYKDNVVSAVQDAHARGFRYFYVMNMAAPDTEPGGGGTYFPNWADGLATYSADFAAFIAQWCTDTGVDAVTIGWEMAGPGAWLPINEDDSKPAKSTALCCPAYKTLYDDARAAIDSDVIVASSSGDADYGYITGWATEMSALGFAPDWYCVYDYRYSTLYTPWRWGKPEGGSAYGDVTTRVDVNIAYYAALFPDSEVVVTEAGYQFEESLEGVKTIDDRTHASLYCRNATLAAASGTPMFVFHGNLDGADSPAGIFNDDLSPRYTAQMLGQLLRSLNTVDSIASNETVYTATTTDGNIVWDTADDSLSYDNIVAITGT